LVTSLSVPSAAENIGPSAALETNNTARFGFRKIEARAGRRLEMVSDHRLAGP